MAAPWTRHYDQEVPPSLQPYPLRTLVDYLRDTAAARPDAPAILFKGRRLSNAELDRLSDRFAASLAEAGVHGRRRKEMLDQVAAQHILETFFASCDEPA